MDLEVLLLSISQFLCNEIKKKNPRRKAKSETNCKIKLLYNIVHDLLNRGLIWMYGS